MIPAEASKLLDLPDHATPDQIEARFNELRARLEDKIAKAPTPGLKAKYRESLEEITSAFETLTLAADSSTLPVLTKQKTEDGGRRTEGDAVTASREPAPANPKSKSQNRKSGREFAFVTVIAIALLGAGGWFVMKTRADNAEQARLAAEALQQKQASEQAESTRLNTLKTSLRTKLAEARVDWEAHESDLQDADRRVNELKSELRGLRDVPATKKAELSAQVTAQEFYTKWLKNHLLRHPAKLARVRAEELLQAGAPDEASAVVGEITSALAKLAEDITYRRRYFFETTTSLRLHSKPEGVRWILTDTYGRTQEGVTPAQLEGLPLTHVVTDGVPVAPFAGVEKRGEFTTGKVSVRFVRTGWPEVVKEDAMLLQDDNPILEAEFAEGAVAVSSLPAGVPFTITQAAPNHGWTASGTTPATLAGVPPGRVTVTLTRPGYRDVSQDLDIVAGQTATTRPLDHRSQPVRIKVAEARSRITIDGEVVGSQEIELVALKPGEHTLQLQAEGYPAYRTKFTVKQEPTPVTLSYSFKLLAVENITCTQCNGQGVHHHTVRCPNCNGTGTVPCFVCDGRGMIYPNAATGYPPVQCSSCRGRRREDCDRCEGGIVQSSPHCHACGGDGRRSQLQLAQ